MAADDLTAAEALLWEAFPLGRFVELIGEEDDRRIRASVITALLLGAGERTGRHVPGVRLRGAHITGKLELRGATVECPLVLTDCVFDEAPQLMESTTRTVRFVRCRMPGLNLARLRLAGILSLRDSAVPGGVRLDHASIDGQLHLTGAVLGAQPAGSALHCPGMRVTGAVKADKGFTATGCVRFTHARFGGVLDLAECSIAAADQWSALMLDNAQVEGTLTLRGSSVANPGGVAVSAGGLTAEGSVWLNHGFTATGEVRFIGAKLRAQLTLEGARLAGASLNLTAASLSGLAASGLLVEGGQVRLANARLTGDLELRDARISAGPGGVALAADGMSAATVQLDRLQAHGRVSLRNTGTGEIGLEEAVLRAGPDGYALRADRARTGALAGEGLRAEGRVSLRGAAVTGDVELPRARLAAGPDDLALVCDGLGAVNVRLSGLEAFGLVSFDDARVTGELDLNGARLDGGDTALSAASLVSGGVRARGLRTAGLVVFEDAQITREIDLSTAALAPDETGLSLAADGLSAGGLNGERLTAQGRLSIRGGQLNGDLVLAGASVGADPEGRAITADGLVAVHLLASGARVGGRMSLRGAQLVGDLELKEARLEPGPGGVSLTGSGMSAGRVRLDRMHAVGRVSFRAARVAGDLSAADAHAGPDENGHAFTAEGLNAVNVQLSRLRAQGMVTLRNSQTTGAITLDGASLEASGVALTASWLTTGGLWASGLGVRGRIMLRGSQVSGEILLEDARLTGDGPSGSADEPADPDGDWAARHGVPPRGGRRAIIADGLSAGALRLNRSRIEGEVALRGARIIDQFDATDARFVNPGRIALRLSLAEVTGDAFLRRTRVEGVLRVSGARIGRVLQLNDAVLDNPDGNALEAEGLQAGRLALRPEQVSGRVVLTHARLGILQDDPATWADTMALDGLTYEALEPRLPPAVRLDWLGRDPSGFQPQPYEQLAAHYTLLGQQREAQEVLLSRERHQRSLAPWRGKAWGRLQDVTVGFGYQPLRAAGWLVLLVALGSLIFWFSPPAPLKPDEAPHFNPVMYTVDLLLPIVDLGQERAFNPAGLDQWFSYLLVAAGWILATTIAAGAARTIRRS